MTEPLQGVDQVGLLQLAAQHKQRERDALLGRITEEDATADSEDADDREQAGA